ncbi:MAG: class I SAM-dependent methyltransferase [Pirellulaceae bacterium]|nr:class I SAM-dependent methyltransferase [Pirellulaceae bacterium]
MTENEITDLGCQSNKDVIRRFISLKGLHVLDVGCGNMGFTRQLTEAGATVLGIDPDPRQAEKNRAAAAEQGMQFEQAGAEAMPVADQVFDGVFFAYSLHHIPEGLYGDVFSEVARVLKPDGFVYVIEPIDCPLNQVMRHFHNEDRERAAAQRALRDLAAPLFQSVEVVTYYSDSIFESFEQFADRFSSRTFNPHYSAEDVRRDAVRQAFETLGGTEHRFQSPKQVMYLKNRVAR